MFSWTFNPKPINIDLCWHGEDFKLVFLFQVTGVLLIITGVIIKTFYTEYLDFLGDAFWNIPVILILLGLIISFIAFFGCFGAIREHYCFTLTFTSLLGILFVVEMFVTVTTYHLQTGVSRAGHYRIIHVIKQWDFLLDLPASRMTSS